MQRYPGFEMNMTAKVDVPEVGQSMSMSGSGVFNGTTGQGKLTMRTSGSPGGDFQMTELIDGAVVYMSSPAFAPVLPAGASWLKLDMSAALPDSQSDLGGFDPTGQFAQLQSVSSNVRAVGSEKVGDAVTTHYTATIDFRKSADAVRDAGDEAGADAIEQFADAGNPTTPVDVWIDSKGLIRRMDMLVPFAPVTGGTGGSMSMSMTLSHFGIKPRIEIPADTAVFDATDLANQALGELDG
jgi:hypothetical protein